MIFAAKVPGVARGLKTCPIFLANCHPQSTYPQKYLADLV